LVLLAEFISKKLKSGKCNIQLWDSRVVRKVIRVNCGRKEWERQKDAIPHSPTSQQPEKSLNRLSES